MTQISILDALDAAGAHPQAVRPRKVLWTDTWVLGDAVPPGLAPPAPDDPEGLPRFYRFYADDYDPEIHAEVWQAVQDSIPATLPEIPFPFSGLIETARLPDGARWACLVAYLDGGLSHVTLRDGELAWANAPGAGKLIWAEGTRTWERLPAWDAWDEEAGRFVPKGSTPKATSAPPDVEAPGAASAETVAPEPVPAEAPLPTGGPGEVVNALLLANDANWQRLVADVNRTTPAEIHRAVRRHVLSGDLSVPNARAILEAAGIAEPTDRSAPALMALKHWMRDLDFGPNAWSVIHGFEDGWVRLRKTRSKLGDPVEPLVTPEGLARIKAPPEEPASKPVAPVPVPWETPPVSGGPAAFLHAIHLATDLNWRKLANSLDRTTPGDVRQAVPRRVLAGDLSVANGEALLERVGLVVPPPHEEPAPVAKPVPDRTRQDNVRNSAARHMLTGSLSVANARALLTRAGVVEPEDRSGSVLLKMKPGLRDLGLGADAWALVHGVEDGWFTLRQPGGPMAPAELTVTLRGNSRIWTPLVQAADGGTFFENIMGLQTASRVARAASRRPLEEMEEAGLIRLCGSHGRAFLPPLSDVLALRYVMDGGNVERIDLYLRESADPDSPLVRRVEAICGVTAKPGGEELWARRASARSQARPRAEGDDDVVVKGIRDGQ